MLHLINIFGFVLPMVWKLPQVPASFHSQLHSITNFASASPVGAQVVESLGTLYHEGAELQSGQVVKYAITELKGDWNWHAETRTNSVMCIVLLYPGPCML